jgi:uncharacterized protein YdbL (DUF1318 family)
MTVDYSSGDAEVTTLKAKSFITMLAAALLMVSLPAFSIDLQTAKAQGLVGETPSGYLEAVTSPTADVKALIESINTQRKQKYMEIASRNNTSLQAVEQLAGEKAITKSKPGHYVKSGGSWQKK